MFQAILDGQKTFDARLNDFNCQVGDTLVLQEWDPRTKKYTGREIKKEISYVLNTNEVAFWSPEDIKRLGLKILGFN